MHAVRGGTLASTADLARVEGHAFSDAVTAAACGRFTACAATNATSSGKKNSGSRLFSRAPARADGNVGALIPICKADAWTELPDDERRAVFEARSRHIAISARYLPPSRAALCHARDLRGPFDFLTWFEFGQVEARVSR